MTSESEGGTWEGMASYLTEELPFKQECYMLSSSKSCHIETASLFLQQDTLLPSPQLWLKSSKVQQVAAAWRQTHRHCAELGPDTHTGRTDLELIWIPEKAVS